MQLLPPGPSCITSVSEKRGLKDLFEIFCYRKQKQAKSCIIVLIKNEDKLHVKEYHRLFGHTFLVGLGRDSTISEMLNFRKKNYDDSMKDVQANISNLRIWS